MKDVLSKVITSYNGLFTDPSVGLFVGGLAIAGIATIAYQARTIQAYSNQIDEMIDADEELSHELRDSLNYIEGYNDCIKSFRDATGKQFPMQNRWGYDVEC